MSGQSVKLLFAQADKTVLTPVLDALREKGIKVSEGSPEGDEDTDGRSSCRGWKGRR